MLATIPRPQPTAARTTALRTTARDPLIDVLRTGALALVVIQHWLLPVLAFDGRELTAGNALTSPGWWALTWITQVMPLVFLAGGAANALSYRRHLAKGGNPAEWLSRRVRRLALPVLPLAAVWVPLPHLLLALGAPEQPVRLAAGIVPQLLWFLAAYLGAVALTPWAVRWHDRSGLSVLLALCGGALVVDSLQFGGFPPEIGFANVLLVWGAVHQVGIAYGSRREPVVPTARQGLLLAGAGYGLLALMVAFGPYPTSMIGLPGAATSNMSPPTACLLALTVGQLGLVALARPALLALVARRPVATALRWAAPRMMTVYLWHMTALTLVAGVLVLGFGVATPTPGSLGWVVGLVPWLVLLAITLRPLLSLFARFEQERPFTPETRTWPVAAGAGLVAAGLLGLTVGGFAPATAPGLTAELVEGPLVWVAAVAAGVALVSRRAAERRR
ncbi:Acyltransferase family protein [Streptoalloteichus tenebrarius]|uniref:Acyltransferase family protein n=1 Tax=Streptoalloteichus tenebrarius (strain ATCC 17920 / DSM 40477 / JCM 4838 / CBS 697.72 / NBRC 16177 / NCIMB 11028 / NRRL B-12390 / A12253. 1 / ISP 5477) TaxID=1933 RepID=A0ABT1HVW8_STRSD|nr:acyltransferase [Streptoalloteichus tenebrarius]MCP2259663.1 Acyltransferase family protein [Streptoalloteichus tenebrarius]BFF00928.1 acyltransferase [Streptoalloteichus tenebrarius]